MILWMQDNPPGGFFPVPDGARMGRRRQTGHP